MDPAEQPQEDNSDKDIEEQANARLQPDKDEESTGVHPDKDKDSTGVQQDEEQLVRNRQSSRQRRRAARPMDKYFVFLTSTAPLDGVETTVPCDLKYIRGRQ